MGMRKRNETDVVLIGAGIMSATLGVILKELDPTVTIRIFERLDVAAAESSDAWNNAGTGHSAFCELNYTPELPDGSIDISKATKIAASFEESKQFWAYLVQQQYLPSANFIRSIPHISFVWGDENVAFLKKRYELLSACYLFKGMKYSEDFDELSDWMPLVMEGRHRDEKLAATRMDLGTDVNFGSLTKAMFLKLREMPGVFMHFNQDVRDIDREDDNSWLIKLKDRTTKTRRKVKAKFVFIGAGGGSLPLLLKTGIPEAKGYGGFPVSGQWLKCINEAVINRHEAKVYGKASVGAPPMSVPHLDTRMIDNKRALLFGPYAGFSTKFLKNGSFMDLPFSVKPSNIFPMLSAGIHNIPLTRYLIEQVRQSPEDRLDALKEYYPNARMEDWELEIAGQRVQVIKKDEEEGGILEFGTEVVSAEDGSIAALLGASPGASTAVSIMLGLIKRCFPEQAASPQWQQKLKQMIPSFDDDLSKNPDLLFQVRTMTTGVLELNHQLVS
jgi:malate dehydrogenase (quinone)